MGTGRNIGKWFAVGSLLCGAVFGMYHVYSPNGKVRKECAKESAYERKMNALDSLGVYEVADGDCNLGEIAWRLYDKRWGVDIRDFIDDIARRSNLDRNKIIHKGDKLTIPYYSIK